MFVDFLLSLCAQCFESICSDSVRAVHLFSRPSFSTILQTAVPLLQNMGIVALRGGMHHSVVLSSNGMQKVFYFHCQCRKCFPENSLFYIHTFFSINIYNFNFAGKLLTFGRGDSGQLGSSQASTKSAGDFSGKPVRILVCTIRLSLFRLFSVLFPYMVGGFSLPLD